MTRHEKHSRKTTNRPENGGGCHISAVLLARQSSLAVVFLRAPKSWTQILRWDTATDTFEMGQWFRGRLHERRCDLSPSGEKLIYFAAKHHLRSPDPSYTSSWTAVSKIPYLTALALWPNGGTTYHGGGLFLTENTLALNSYVHRHSNPARDQPARPHPRHVPPSGIQVEPLVFTAGDALFPLRLVRDGWKLTTPGDVQIDGSVSGGRFVRTNKAWPRPLQLDLTYQEATYSLPDHPIPDLLAGATWADWDHQGHLLFARDAKLFRLPAGPSSSPTVLADFHDRRPRRLQAPEWAHTW